MLIETRFRSSGFKQPPPPPGSERAHSEAVPSGALY